MNNFVILPFPPSTNHLFPGKTRRFKSKAYEVWLYEAWFAFNQQSVESFTGEVIVTMRFGRPDKRRRDVSNYIKAPEDFLVTTGILEDDSQVIDIRALWDDEINGVQVEIEAA